MISYCLSKATGSRARIGKDAECPEQLLSCSFLCACKDVEAHINYLQQRKGSPVMQSVSMKKLVRDARRAGCTLETCGFELGSINMSQVASSIDEFQSDRPTHKTRITRQALKVIQERLPKAQVIPFDAKCRQSGTTSSSRPPVNFVAYAAGRAPPPKGCFYGEMPASPFQEAHGDYTPTSAKGRIQALVRQQSLTKQLSERLLAGLRFFFVNVWGNLSPSPLKRKPLALVDARTVQVKDTFGWVQQGPNDTAVYDGFSGGAEEDFVKESLGVQASSPHEWYYFPEMKRGEALLFKTFDNAEEGEHIRVSLHSAFEHPATQDTDPARQSFEVRLLVVPEPF